MQLEVETTSGSTWVKQVSTLCIIELRCHQKYLFTVDDQGNKGPFKWLNSNEEPTQAFWAPSQPSGDGRCVANSGRDWTVERCAKQFHYACMKKRGGKLGFVVFIAATLSMAFV